MSREKQIQEESNNLLFKAVREAVKEKDISNIKKALDNGADVNAKNQYGETPLISGIPSGYGSMHEIDKEVVILLLKRGAYINAKNKYGDTALHKASHLVKIESCNKSNEMTTEEIKESRLGMITLLLDNNANIDAQDKEGNTPIYLATYSGADDVVNLLITRGANIDKKNIYNKKPIDCANNGNIQEILTNAAARRGSSFLDIIFGKSNKKEDEQTQSLLGKNGSDRGR